MQGRVRLVLVGDSLTQQGWQGWIAKMADWYGRKGECVNRGYSGYTSRWLLMGVYDSILNEECQWNIHTARNLMTICFGANDSSRGEGDLRFVPIEEFKNNIEGMVRAAREKVPGLRIVLITPPRVNEEMWEGRSDVQVQPYAEALRALAARLSCGLADLWLDMDDSPSVDKDDLNDGLHFGPAAHEKVFRRVQRAIRTYCPDLDPTWDDDGKSVLEQHYPDWRAMVGKSLIEQQGMVGSWQWAHDDSIN